MTVPTRRLSAALLTLAAFGCEERPRARSEPGFASPNVVKTVPTSRPTKRPPPPAKPRTRKIACPATSGAPRAFTPRCCLRVERRAYHGTKEPPSVALSADGKRLAVGIEGVELWDLARCARTRVLRWSRARALPSPKVFVDKLRFSSDGKWLAAALLDLDQQGVGASGGRDDRVALWRLRDGARLWGAPLADDDKVNDLEFVDTNQQLALRLERGGIRLRRVADGKRGRVANCEGLALPCLTMGDGGPLRLSTSRGGALLVSDEWGGAGKQGMIVWTVRDGGRKSVHRDCPRFGAEAARLSPSMPPRLARANGCLAVYDAKTGRRLAKRPLPRAIRPRLKGALEIGFSNDGRRVGVSGAKVAAIYSMRRRRLRLLRPRFAAAPKKRPEGVPESMQAAVWAPDLRWLVLVADGRFAVIDPSRPRREAGRLPSLPQFSRGGARAVTVRGAQVVVWAVAR